MLCENSFTCMTVPRTTKKKRKDTTTQFDETFLSKRRVSQKSDEMPTIAPLSASTTTTSSLAQSSNGKSPRAENNRGVLMRKTSRVMISTPRAESSSSSSSSSEKTESAEMSSQGVDASGSSNDAKETLSKLAEEGGFPVWLPEVVNGRICMVGLSIGASVEVTQHMTLLEQVPHSLVQLALLGGSIIYASTKPFEFNPQNGYNANPESLEGIRDTPGMLVVEKCNFTPKVEMAHGRIAMTAFTILCLIELISGKPFFG